MLVIRLGLPQRLLLSCPLSPPLGIDAQGNLAEDVWRAFIHPAATDPEVG